MLNLAVQNRDLDSYIKAREEQDKKNREAFIEGKDEGRREAYYYHVPLAPENDFFSPQKGEPLILPFDPQDEIKDFDSLEELMDHFKCPDRRAAFIDVEERQPYDDKSVTKICVRDFYFAESLRGTGAGTYFMKTLERYADKKGYMMQITPTEVGDGTFSPDHPKYVEAGEMHRKRLMRFYGRHGFVLNPFFSTSSSRKRPEEEEWIIKHQPLFSYAGEKLLRDMGQMVRFPNNKIPAKYLAKTVTK